MSKNLKLILILIGIILIGIIGYFAYKEISRKEADLTFPKTIIVQNATDVKVDKVVKALAYHVSKYDTMKITIVYIPTHIQNMAKDIDIRAYVQPNKFRKKTYFIYIARNFRKKESEMVFSHEFCHIQQFERGDLKEIGVGIVKYKGKIINYYEVPYKERAHEIDAFKCQSKNYKELRNVLYIN